MATTSTHLVVMGVSGSGKTTVGTLLAERLGWVYGEADSFHPPANVDRMAAGIPLVDEDRWPWLRRLRDWMSQHAAAGRDTVLACSALRRAYRDVLREAGGPVRFVHLSVDPEVLARRMTHRRGHFMPPELLKSQLEALEPLTPDEDGIVVDADAPPDEVVRRIVDWSTTPN